MSNTDAVAGFHIEARAFRELLERVMPAMGKDEARPVLASVLIETEGGRLRMVAADNYRIAIQDFEVNGGVIDGEWPQVLLPRWQMPVVIAFLKSRPEGAIRIEALPEHRLRISDSQASIDLWTLEARFPNYRQIMAEHPLLETGEPTVTWNPRLTRNLPKDLATVEVTITGPLEPVLLRDPASGFRLIVMPLRTARLKDVPRG